MNIKISKWGNSYGIRLPKKMLTEMGFAEHTEFDIFQKGNTFLLKPRQIRKKTNILWMNYLIKLLLIINTR